MTNNVLFLGCFYPEEEIELIRKNTKGGLQNASNLLQWDYIHGIEYNLGDSIDIMTRMSLGIYPYHYNQAYIRRHSYDRGMGKTEVVLGFWNTIPLRPMFFNYVGIKEIHRWAKNVKGEGVVIAYSYAMAPILRSLKRHFGSIKTVLILPDLPRYTYMANDSSLFYRIRRGVDEGELKKAIPYLDLLVPITKQMGDVIDPEKKVRKIVIEGMANCDQPMDNISKNSEQFVVAYTGSLTKAYGLMSLLDALDHIPDQNFRLVICGAGEAESDIIKRKEKDTRIVFKGAITPQEARKIQENANLLINPRSNEGDYTKYSFPSKILQYMASGTPVLCYKLSGFADDYDEYLMYIDKNEKLYEAIIRIMKMKPQDLVEIGKKAKEYAIKEKSVNKQTKRLLDEIACL